MTLIAWLACSLSFGLGMLTSCAAITWLTARARTKVKPLDALALTPLELVGLNACCGKKPYHCHCRDNDRRGRA